MKEEKNIDRLFQEKFKNFDVSPDPAVWDKIHAELHNDKKKRRVIPIWWRIGGIAAGLALLLTIGYSVFNKTDVTSDNNVVVEEVIEDKKDSQLNDDVQNQPVIPSNTDDAILKNNMTSQDASVASETGNEKETIISTIANSEQDASNNRITNNSNKSTSKDNQTTIYNSNKTNTVATQNKPNPINSNNKTLNGTLQKNNYNSSSIPTNNVVTNNIPQNLPEQPTTNSSKQNDATIQESKTAVTATDHKTQDVPLKEDASKEITEAVKPSIEDAIANSEDEEEINEKEKEVINRWSVTPNVSPVYFNTMGKGSSIHSQFNNNSKNGDLNLGNDVVVYQNIGSLANTNLLRNIALNPESGNTSIISSDAIQVADAPQIVTQNFKASLNQEIAFVEVPLEMVYKLSDKKLGVNLIGGFSTMFLQENTIYAQIRNESTPIGKATNINDVSYSANLGVGLELKISERVNLNLEPAFKYQINTFNNTSGDFQPYILSVSSGLKFKF